MALLLGAALLPMGLMTLDAGLRSASLAEGAAQREVAERVRERMMEREGEVVRLRTVTRTIAANASFARGGSEQCNAVLGTLGAEFREFANVTVLDTESRIVCASDPAAVGRTASAGPLVRRAQVIDDAAIGFVPSPRLSGEPVLAAVSPIVATRGPQPLFVGVTRVSAPLLARPPGGETVFSALVGADGRVLQVSGLALQSPDYRALERVLAERAPGGRSGPFRVGSLWAVTVELADANIFLVEGWRRPPPDLAGILGMLWAMFAPVLVWLIAVGATWMAVELYIVRPLTAVEALARSYARGEDADPPEALRNAPLEIASVRRTLAAMAKTLRGREHRLAEALQEERALLREVNHRVNNNLQLVASLLSIQARAATVEQQAVGLARAHDRVQLLALAHNKIYGSGHVRCVRVDDLVSEIARNLTAARGARSGRLILNLDVHPAHAPVDNAVPLAFLIGESISQAIDLLDGIESAVLDVSLRRSAEDDVVTFSVTSPNREARAAATSPARRIIDAFSRQIGVTVDYSPDDPLAVTLSMRVASDDVVETQARAAADVPQAGTSASLDR
ncbi:MAG: histidine kinase dimerization/phosphoacceptor domain -containing protein [Hyphomonadaceae bacterium]|nr:histidine kinase dimerization/phosphoacceptor domain -containing protein [Hyphomonadaceae bacterium]